MGSGWKRLREGMRRGRRHAHSLALPNGQFGDFFGDRFGFRFFVSAFSLGILCLRVERADTSADSWSLSNRVKSAYGLVWFGLVWRASEREGQPERGNVSLIFISCLGLIASHKRQLWNTHVGHSLWFIFITKVLVRWKFIRCSLWFSKKAANGMEMLAFEWEWMNEKASKVMKNCHETWGHFSFVFWSFRFS